jgi:hypothetical protein
MKITLPAVLALLLVASAARSAEVKVLLSTPVSVRLEVSCKNGEACDQLAADQAQGYLPNRAPTPSLPLGEKIVLSTGRSATNMSFSSIAFVRNVTATQSLP